MSRQEYHGYDVELAPPEETFADKYNKIVNKRLGEFKLSKFNFNVEVLGTDADVRQGHWGRCVAGLFFDIVEMERFQLAIQKDVMEQINKDILTIFSCGCCVFENPEYVEINKRLQDIKILKQKISEFAKRTGKKDFDFDREYEILSKAIDETAR